MTDGRSAEEIVMRLREDGAKPAHEYRCRNAEGRHLLAATYIDDGEHYAYFPRYQLPDGINAEQSTPEGRAAHTSDGWSKYAPRAVHLDPIARWGGADDRAPRGQFGAVWYGIRCRDWWGGLDPAEMIDDADGPERRTQLPREERNL